MKTKSITLLLIIIFASLSLSLSKNHINKDNKKTETLIIAPIDDTLDFSNSNEIELWMTKPFK